MMRSPWITMQFMFVVLAGLLPSRFAVGQRPADAPAPQRDTTVDEVIQREIERASARGIPPTPLLAKIREGRIKRASGERIRVAVAALIVRLDTARAALGASAAPEELAAGADALAAGAGAAALRAIRAASVLRPMGAPLGALAQLVANGVSVQRAVAMIVELLRRNVGPAQLVAFGNSVEADAAGGVPAEESALFRLRAIGGPAAGASTAVDASPAVTGGTRVGPTSTPVTPKRRP